MANSPNNLYFIALIPPAPIYDEAHRLKQYFKENYNSKHALKSPPHITLISPFRLPKGRRDELDSLLESESEKLSPFKIRLKNFSRFSPGVIFIDVEKSEPLTELQTDLEEVVRSNKELFSYNYDERDYHPHLTLAFKDLSKKNFYKAWDEFKNKTYEDDFRADRLSLLKHDGRRWQVAKEFMFDEH